MVIVFPISFTKFKRLQSIKLEEATRIFTKAALWRKMPIPKKNKEMTNCLWRSINMTPLLMPHLPSSLLIFRSHLMQTEAKANIHHVQSCLLSLRQAVLRKPCHCHAMLLKASAKQDPSVIYNEGAHFIINSQAHGLRARPLPPHGGGWNWQRLVFPRRATTRSNNDRFVSAGSGQTPSLLFQNHC